MAVAQPKARGGNDKVTASMRPRDMIDLQSFLRVQGSDEYPD
jgi:hypothetical protein